jgi:hypothetical protein
VEVSNQITLLILYYISSRLVTVLQVIDAPEQVSDIFFLILTLSSKFMNCSFLILRLLVPEMSTSFASYIVYIIHFALVWILQPPHFSLLSVI